MINTEKNDHLPESIPFDILNNLATDLDRHKKAFIDLKIVDTVSFYKALFETLNAQVTPSNIKNLTNEAPSATYVGNFFRFLLEIIHVLEDITGMFFALPPRPYRTQFFASKTETNVVQGLKNFCEALETFQPVKDDYKCRI